jgi:D-sedoheptulose 7-phosphate isomerase
MTRSAFAEEARDHVRETRQSLTRVLAEVNRLEHWGQCLAQMFSRGGRLLAAGNGGSAAHAQHLTSELVGRYRDERAPLSAIPLHGDSSTLTALVNDYGAHDAFARQVRAHGRPGDVFLAFSTSGKSRNVLEAISAARSIGMETWAITGPAPNPLAACAHDAVAVDAVSTATIQEVHQVLVHLLCEGIEDALRALGPPTLALEGDRRV